MEEHSIVDHRECRSCNGKPAFEPLLNVPELANALKVRVSWVYGETRRGKLPMIRVGRHIRFQLSVVLSHLQAK